MVIFKRSLTGKTQNYNKRDSCHKRVIAVVVQFYPWFKFYFPLFLAHYHTLRYPKTKENKI